MRTKAKHERNMSENEDVVDYIERVRAMTNAILDDFIYTARGKRSEERVQGANETLETFQTSFLNALNARIHHDGVNLVNRAVDHITRIPGKLMVEAWTKEYNYKALEKYRVLPWCFRYPGNGSWKIVVGSRVRVGEGIDENGVVVGLDCGTRCGGLNFLPLYNVRTRCGTFSIRTWMIYAVHSQQEIEAKAIKVLKPFLMMVLEHLRWRPDSALLKKSRFIEEGQQRLQEMHH